MKYIMDFLLCRCLERIVCITNARRPRVGLPNNVHRSDTDLSSYLPRSPCAWYFGSPVLPGHLMLDQPQDEVAIAVIHSTAVGAGMRGLSTRCPSYGIMPT